MTIVSMKLETLFFILFLSLRPFAQLWTPFNLLLMNLVVLEFASASFGLPLNFISSLRQGWHFGETLCTATAFVMAVAGELDLARSNLRRDFP